MSRPSSRISKHLEAIFVIVAFAGNGLAAPSAVAAAAGRSGGRGGGGVHLGVPSSGRSMIGARSPARQTGFGAGFRGGSGHRRQHGFGRSTPRHQFQTRSLGFHRFHRRSPVVFNLGGFAYPPYSYYEPYYSPSPYYPSYPTTSMPYDPGYPAGNAPYPYPDPVGAYPQPIQGNVQVYAAPSEPSPVPPYQPAPMLEHSSLPSPLGDGSLHFEIGPPEAKIFLDDRYLGEAHELRNIAEITAPAGRHLLEIRTDTERTFTEVVVSPHKVTPVRWPLAPSAATPAAPIPEGGRLRVQVTLPGAAIYVDGVFSAVADLAHPLALSVSAGHHRVQVVLPGYKAYSSDVIVPEGAEAVVEVQLARE